MRVVLQRSKYSKVTIDGKINGEIDKGLVILVGFTNGDDEKIVDKMIDKIINLRIFEDENGLMNKSLIDEIKRLGGNVYMSRTGTSFTEANTKENNIPLGGELSGHIFFNDRGPEICSAIYAGLRFIEILSKNEKSFSQLLEGITPYISTPEIKITCPNEIKFQIVEKVKEYVKEKQYDYLDIDGVRVNFPNSWALIRASNTGPNLTLRFEATEERELLEKQKEFTELVNELMK